MLELPNKGDKILDLQWEPHGNRFAVLHGEGPRPNFSLYAMKDMRTSAKVVQLVGTQTGKQANCIFWSPQARGPPVALLDLFVIFSGLRPARAQASILPDNLFMCMLWSEPKRRICVHLLRGCREC